MRIATLSAGAALLLFFGSCCQAVAEDRDQVDIATLSGRSFPAVDSLDTGEESSADARECLEGLSWEASKFVASCQPSRPDRGDLLVRFPSPIESGVKQNDQVAMEWYVARDENNQPVSARAVIVVHESGRRMTVGRMFAQGLRHQGLHAFLLHLPYYGERRTEGKRPSEVDFITMMRQAIADARRARDAVAALPLIDTSHIALQGTSLGGFVSATTACLDRGYDSVFLMLAGGELYDLLQNGRNETAKVREELAKAGLSGEKLKSLAQRIEPTRVAHRLDPQRTWLFSGCYDSVVPPKNAFALSKAAGLDDSHHIQLLANHYTGIVYLPFVLSHIHAQIVSLDIAPDDN
jgi:dienelactone hydrolase